MAIALINRQSKQNTGADPQAFSSLSATQAGAFLVAVITLRTGSSQSVSGVTDSGGNTWTKQCHGNVSGANTRVEIWTAPGTASITTLTADLSASLAASLDLYEFSGVDPSTPIHTKTADGTGSSDNVSDTSAGGGSLTTSVAGCVLVHGISWALTTANTASSVSGDYTLGGNLTGTATLHGIATAYQLAAPAASYTCTFTTTASITNGYAAVALLPASNAPRALHQLRQQGIA